MIQSTIKVHTIPYFRVGAKCNNMIKTNNLLIPKVVNNKINSSRLLMRPGKLKHTADVQENSARSPLAALHCITVSRA